MPKSRPPYPAEYRSELVRLVREEGRTPTELAREFEPSAQSIANWVAQADIDAGRRDGLTSEERAELKRLRSENRVLRMEKDLLGKAAAFFAAKNTPAR
jgi:transposase